MKIVGVGIGPGMITQEAAVAIQQAGLVYGSPRALELAAGYIHGEARTIENYSLIHELPPGAVVLSTGEPNLSGLGKYAGPDDVVIPGISSLQVACARLKVDLTGVVMITAHGRYPKPAITRFKQAITSEATVFLLPSSEFGVGEVADVLKSIELDVPIAVLEQLGYPDERIEVGSALQPPRANSRLYCILAGSAIRLHRD